MGKETKKFKEWYRLNYLGSFILGFFWYKASVKIASYDPQHLPIVIGVTVTLGFLLVSHLINRLHKVTSKYLEDVKKFKSYMDDLNSHVEDRARKAVYNAVDKIVNEIETAKEKVQ